MCTYLGDALSSNRSDDGVGPSDLQRFLHVASLLGAGSGHTGLAFWCPLPHLCSSLRRKYLLYRKLIAPSTSVDSAIELKRKEWTTLQRVSDARFLCFDVKIAYFIERHLHKFHKIEA